jgi:poly-beta-1,6-N-acetyl-D-glucosamine biosynthesis protein PgaD
MRIRDVVLTVLAWLFLGWLLRDPLYLAYDFLRPPFFELTASHPDAASRLERLRIFGVVSIGLVYCLSLLAIGSYRQLRSDACRAQPPLLTAGEQTARFGIDESLVAEARRYKIAVVQLREDGSIARIEESSA